MYFHANLDLHSNITNIENEVRVLQSFIYDYFKLMLIVKTLITIGTLFLQNITIYLELN